MTETVLIPAGKRTGRTFTNERALRRKLDEGDFRVITEYNRVYFDVLAEGDEGVRYVALTEKPADLIAP